MTPLDPSLQQIIQTTVREVLAQLRRGVPVVPATFNTTEAATYLGISPSKLSRLRHSGRSPPYIRISTSIRYRREDLDRWLEQQMVKGD